MNRVIRSVTLAGDQHYANRPPAESIAPALAWLPRVVGESIAMAVRGQSRARGVKPEWFRRAVDIRFGGIEGDDHSTLVFEVPTLGEAAPELFGQPRLLPPFLPHPDRTGFDLLADVVLDVVAHDSNSERFDDKLLGRFARFNQILGKDFREVRIGSDSPDPVATSATIDAQVIATAEEFRTSTPPSRPVRVVGKLDMVRISTNSFGLRLDDGQDVRGVLVEGGIDAVIGWLDQRVLVLGRAVYRPSGQLLRIEASEVLSGKGQSAFWSRIPEARPRKFDLQRAIREQIQKPSKIEFFGQWPGDETDEQIEQALREIG